MAEQEKAGGGQIGVAVSDAELTESYSVPAFYCNKINITWAPNGVRVAFMEGHYRLERALVRTAIALTWADAVELRNLLSEVLAAADVTVVNSQPPAQAGPKKDG